MMVQPLFLAEIVDKMPTVPGTAIGSMNYVGLFVALSRVRWWLYLIPLPLIIWTNIGEWGQLQEPGFGREIISELGWDYVVGQFFWINAPYLLATGYVWRQRQMQIRRRRLSRGLCPDCSYDLKGHSSPEPVCPECGALLAQRNSIVESRAPAPPQTAPNDS